VSERLDAEADEFAARLTSLIRGSVGGDTEFTVVESDGGVRRRIGPGPADTEKGGFSRIPLLRRVDPPGGPERVSLKVEFAVGLDDDRERLFNDWANPGWRRVLEASLGDWERLQARATVRRYPDAAAEELARLGFDVKAPGRRGGTRS
jgi:hypothetical protein